MVDELGGVDIFFIGVGVNGHLAFNEAMDRSLLIAEDFIKLGMRALDLSRDTLVIDSYDNGGYIELIL